MLNGTMFLSIDPDWNFTMTIGAIIALDVTFVYLTAFATCFIRMESILRSKRLISNFDFLFPLLIYNRFNKLANQKNSDGHNYLCYIKVARISLLITPIALIFGLLIVAIGSN